MFTISDILMDIKRGCIANNMIENCFTYRIIYYVNEGNSGKKFYVDSPYGNLGRALESIVRNNLSTRNNIVIAQTTTLKDGKCVCLQNRSYSFSLEEYFKRVKGETRNSMPNQYAIG